MKLSQACLGNNYISLLLFFISSGIRLQLNFQLATGSMRDRIAIAKVKLLTLYNFQEKVEMKVKDKRRDSKQVVEEKRKRQRRARSQLRVLPKEKYDMELQQNKCEDGKNSLRWESNPGPQRPQASTLPPCRHCSPHQPVMFLQISGGNDIVISRPFPEKYRIRIDFKYRRPSQLAQ